jgi:BirA family biotin operon repressor/biotin-[acetyl-CoA-carboxylase] ligase
MIDVPQLQKGLKTKAFGRKVYAFETIDSTNSCARTMAAAWASEGTVVVAEHQSEGRGRMGRSWSDSAGESLTFSIVLRPKLPPEGASLLPLLAGLAVAEGIEGATGLKAECKWPNDLLLEGKKVCGILCEGSAGEEGLEHVIVGIGLNVNQLSFSPEIEGRATSVALARGGQPTNREGLLRTILQRFESLYHEHRKTGFSRIPELFERRATMFGSSITLTLPDSSVTGIARRIAPDGGLVLSADGTERTLYAGDVSFHPQNGTPNAPGD